MNKTRGFFKRILEQTDTKNIDKLLVVTHVVKESEHFILAVNDVKPIAFLVPKSSSLCEKTSKKISSFVDIFPHSKFDIRSKCQIVIDDIKKKIGSSSFAIIDTGGYFSTIVQPLFKSFKHQLVGIVEDTENGYQKYQKVLNEHGKTPFPIVSVARSKLKDPEDYLVGQAIVFSADSLLREVGQILTGKKAVVFGYGKIGSSIARHLSVKGVQVKVYDSNPIKQVLALSHGYQTNSREILLSSSDIIFCATGNKSINPLDFSYIKRNSFIFTATSADDEIDSHEELIKNSKSHLNTKISKVSIGGNEFFLCNEGNAANFMHGGVVGPFINLVQAELLLGLSELSSASKERISEIEDKRKEFISDAWMNCFYV